MWRAHFFPRKRGPCSLTLNLVDLRTLPPTDYAERDPDPRLGQEGDVVSTCVFSLPGFLTRETGANVEGGWLPRSWNIGKITRRGYIDRGMSMQTPLFQPRLGGSSALTAQRVSEEACKRSQALARLPHNSTGETQAQASWLSHSWVSDHRHCHLRLFFFKSFLLF